MNLLVLLVSALMALATTSDRPSLRFEFGTEILLVEGLPHGVVLTTGRHPRESAISVGFDLPKCHYHFRISRRATRAQGKEGEVLAGLPALLNEFGTLSADSAEFSLTLAPTGVLSNTERKVEFEEAKLLTETVRVSVVPKDRLHKPVQSSNEGSLTVKLHGGVAQLRFPAIAILQVQNDGVSWKSEDSSGGAASVIVPINNAIGKHCLESQDYRAVRLAAGVPDSARGSRAGDNLRFDVGDNTTEASVVSTEIKDQLIVVWKTRSKEKR